MVIGAGSVVTKNIPADHLAFGNPCQVIHPITSIDRQNYIAQFMNFSL